MRSVHRGGGGIDVYMGEREFSRTHTMYILAASFVNCAASDRLFILVHCIQCPNQLTLDNFICSHYMTFSDKWCAQSLRKISLKVSECETLISGNIFRNSRRQPYCTKCFISRFVWYMSAVNVNKAGHRVQASHWPVPDHNKPLLGIKLLELVQGSPVRIVSDPWTLLPGSYIPSRWAVLYECVILSMWTLLNTCIAFLALTHIISGLGKP